LIHGCLSCDSLDMDPTGRLWDSISLRLTLLSACEPQAATYPHYAE
jgi:hypothetical protein